MLLSMLGTVFHNNLEKKENLECSVHVKNMEIQKSICPRAGLPYLLHDGYKYCVFLRLAE